jgi:hypothetical protein
MNLFQSVYKELPPKLTLISWFYSVIFSFFNLTTVMYQETTEDGHFKVVAVVSSSIGAANLTELENKKACFPEFGGLGKNYIF